MLKSSDFFLNDGTSFVPFFHFSLGRMMEDFEFFPDFISQQEAAVLMHRIYSAPRTKWVQLRNRRLQLWGVQPTVNGDTFVQFDAAAALPEWLNSGEFLSSFIIIYFL